MFPTIRHQKVREPELQCCRCKGTGWTSETTNRGSYSGSVNVEGPCEECNGTGRDPATKTISLELTKQQIEFVVRALREAKDSLEDDARRDIFQSLYEKFNALI
jgi:hypothetical protein